MKYSTLRRITILIFLIGSIVALAFHTGTGSLSSFGWDAIAYICPLGSIEAMIASWTLLPRPIIVLLVLIVIGFFVGKVFCAWVCPVPPIKRFFTKKPKHHEHHEHHPHHEAASKTEADAAAVAEDAAVVAAEEAPVDTEAKPEELTPVDLHVHKCGSCGSCGEKRKKIDSRHIVLGGALLSTAAFGFPVFCLVCPVGLVFASIVVWWRFFGFAEFTLTLFVFPAILLLEILVLRKWCLKFCPLGAVMSLMSLPNKFFRPQVDMDKCLRSQGIECNRCGIVCEEELDPHSPEGMHECSKCGLCVEACPTQAISMKFSPSKPKKETPAVCSCSEECKPAEQE